MVNLPTFDSSQVQGEFIERGQTLTRSCLTARSWTVCTIKCDIALQAEVHKLRKRITISFKLSTTSRSRDDLGSANFSRATSLQPTKSTRLGGTRSRGVSEIGVTGQQQVQPGGLQQQAASVSAPKVRLRVRPSVLWPELKRDVAITAERGQPALSSSIDVKSTEPGDFWQDTVVQHVSCVPAS